MPASNPWSAVVDRGASHVDRASRFLGGFRWVFMPLGLVALIAVGVHAAVDTLDVRVLRLVSGVDAAFDSLFARWPLTAHWVDAIGTRERTIIARVIALLWELAADVIICWPALGYRERGSPAAAVQAQHWQQLLRAWRDKPNTMRLTRPFSTFAVCLAGSCAVAQLIRGALYLSTRGWLGDGVSGLVSRLVALVVLGGVLVSLGWRAVLQNVRDADVVSQEDIHTRTQRIRVGLLGSIVVVPLALGALWDATPLLGFFR